LESKSSGAKRKNKFYNSKIMMMMMMMMMEVVNKLSMKRMGKLHKPKTWI
jgi:hypothetical protein